MMESRTPVVLTGVRVGACLGAGGNPQVKNKTGGLYGHPVHSTVTHLLTPVYRCAPKGMLYTRIMER